MITYPVTNIIWLYLMITPILCGLFLCVLNLTLFLIYQFFAYVSIQFDHTIKDVQCDNDPEFDNASYLAFFVHQSGTSSDVLFLDFSTEQ
jgi:hypothetical protein